MQNFQFFLAQNSDNLTLYSQNWLMGVILDKTLCSLHVNIKSAHQLDIH